MTLRIRPIDAAVADAFVNSHPKEHFMQSSLWMKAKSTDGWDHLFLGFFEGEEMRATAAVLYKKIPLIGKKLFYCPRGPVADYGNDELLAAMTEALRGYLKQNGALSFRMDPDIAITALDKYDAPRFERSDLPERLMRLGWKHGGYNMNFEKSQPRFTFRLPLDGGIDAVYDNLDRMAKKNLKFSAEAGIHVYPSEDLGVFFKIMSETAERDDFYEGSRSYFERIYPLLRQAGMAQLWYAKYEPAAHLKLIERQEEELKKELSQAQALYNEKPTPRGKTKCEQLTQTIERVAKQKETALAYAASHPNGLDLSTLITVNTPHRMWTMWGGSRNELRAFAANYRITWAAIELAAEQKMQFVDFFGSTGDPRPDNPITGIYAFKKKFSGDFVEFPGEFTLILSPVLYWLWTAFSPFLLRVRRRLRKRKA